MPDLVRVSYFSSGRTSQTNPMRMRRRDRASRRRWLGALSLRARCGRWPFGAATLKPSLAQDSPILDALSHNRQQVPLDATLAVATMS